VNSLFWRYYHGNDARASYRWMMLIFIMFGLFPGVGSGGSVMFIGLWLFALPYWIFDQDSRHLTPDENKLVLVFAAYFLIMAGFAVVHAIILGRVSGFNMVINNLPFLLVAPAFPVLRRAARPGWTAAVFAGTACGAIAAAAVVSIGGLYSDDLLRTGFSGNELILALGTLVSGLLCVHGALFFRGRMRWLTAAGALASIYVLLISGGRGPLLAYFAAMALYAIIMGHRHFGLRWMFRRVLVWIALLIAIVAVTAKSDPELGQRYQFVMERLSNPTGGSVAEGSILTRIVLYEAGVETILERPMTGYGRQNVIPAVKAHSDMPDHFFLFSHLHNGYLTDLVASGILGLLSLLAVLLVPLLVFWNTRPVVFGGVLMVVLAYIFYGATNLLFYQDVVTMLFLAVMCVFHALAGVEA
jgi:O-antigen ligase